MPVKLGSDSKGKYYRWGTHGKKYYFKSLKEGIKAKAKAELQGRAIEFSLHR